MMSRKEFDKLRIDMWVSGSCDKQGNGGFATLMQSVVLGKELTKTFAGYAKETTITRMTLRAVLAGLKAIKKPSIIHIYTTCAQVSSGMNKHMYQWAKKDWKTKSGDLVQHADLWQEIYEQVAVKAIGIKVHYQKTSPNQDNNMRVIHRSAHYVQQAKKTLQEVVLP